MLVECVAPIGGSNSQDRAALIFQALRNGGQTDIGREAGVTDKVVELRALRDPADPQTGDLRLDNPESKTLEESIRAGLGTGCFGHRG